jgi:hypothetical protein
MFFQLARLHFGNTPVMARRQDLEDRGAEIQLSFILPISIVVYWKRTLSIDAESEGSPYSRGKRKDEKG